MKLRSCFFGITAALISSICTVFGQSTFQPLDPDIYHWISRAEIKTSAMNGKFHSAVLPYSRKEIVELLDSNQHQNAGKLSRIDRSHLVYFREVNHEWVPEDSTEKRKPVLRYFFSKKADALSYRDKSFDIHVNVAGNGALGQSSDQQGRMYMNNRGFELRGMIAERVGFYTFLTENQMAVPGYVSDWTQQYNSLPHEGFWKRINKKGEYDFFTARGYFTFTAARHIHFQVGHDRLHVGNGLRSLVLSDFGNNYSFARINTKVWKLQYTNVFANMKGNIGVGPSGTPGSRLIPDKYVFFHRLGLNIGKQFNLGLFESIVAGRDPKYYPNGTRLDLSYLNPIIFYRSLEQNSGSPDNAGLGFDVKWNAWKRIQLYGQVFLDEFLLKEIRAQNGWWGNKYALQAGARYLDAFGIDNLDLQGEINYVRPFTYTHMSDYTNYTHYSQPLAHPLGANFSELIGVIRYQPHPQLNIVAHGIWYQKGLDRDGLNYGGDIFRPYFVRVQDYGNTTGQGRKQQIFLFDVALSYQPWINVFLEFRGLFRKRGGEILPNEQNTQYVEAAVRINMPKRMHLF